MRDLRLAVRTLLKTPFVTAIAVLSLALGIGANAAIFSLFDQMLMRPLPVREPEALVNLGAPGPKQGSMSCSDSGGCENVFSYAMYRDLERAPRSPFSALAAHRGFGANMSVRRQTLNGEAWLVSGSYFPVLGLQPAIGRLLTPEDDRTVGAHFVVVLSHAFWTTRLGARPDVIGEAMTINGQQMTIVGVAPENFHGTTITQRPLVYVPLTMRGQMAPGFTGFDDRRNYWAYVFGRLKPGVTVEQARTAMNAIYRPIVNDVEAALQEDMSPQTMARFRAREVILEPGARGQSSIDREARTPILLLFGITGIVLLIACANIANLLLARSAAREMEMAVRLSIGATRGQLLRQLLSESVLLAFVGGLASIGVAFGTLTAILQGMPVDARQTLTREIDGPVLLFAAALSLATGLLFGLFPALHSTRPDLVTTLRANSGKTSSARAATRFRTSLVTAQIALSMALLISAGLFIRSLGNVSRVDLGVRTDNVVTFAVSPELSGYTPARAHALFARLEEAIAATPGVTGVSASLVPILSGSNWGNDVSVQGFKRDPDTDANAQYNEVGPGYFTTLGIPLLAGRAFTTADDSGAPRVAIVNEAFTKKFGLGRDAVGKLMGRGDTDSLNIQIVGVVQNAKYADVKDSVPPLFYTPYRQDVRFGSATFYVSTATTPEPILRQVPGIVNALDAELPVEELKTLPTQVRENTFLDRMISVLCVAFAGLATLLAAVGLYGVLAFTVAQRTREIGVRMALGADAGRVRMLVMRQVAAMTLVGGLIGIAAALGLGRAARSLLYELDGHDPLVIAIAVVVLTLVALGAGYLPARRAARIPPMRALRYE